MRVSTEAKIGMIGVLAIAFTVWGLNFLKGRNILKAVNQYYALYEDIGGLEVNAPISMNGYRIGQVNNIHFTGNKQKSLAIVLGIHRRHSIPVRSIAELYSEDIMGTKAIRIIASENNRIHERGDTLISSVETGMLNMLTSEFEMIGGNIGSIILGIDSLTGSMNRVFNHETTGQMKKTIEHMSHGAENIDKILDENGRLVKILDLIESVSSNLEENNRFLTIAIRNISSISDSLVLSELKSTIANANASLSEMKQILGKINRGEGSVGLLVHNDSLYRKLETTSNDLDLLIRDVNENPKKYVHFSIFGKK